MKTLRATAWIGLQRGDPTAQCADETVSTVSLLALSAANRYPSFVSLHSCSRVWLHALWGTLERRPLLTMPAAVKVSEYLHYYSDEKSVYMKINYVNPDHVHVLVDLTANLSIEQMMHLLKGASSHRINERNLLPRKFGWARGYGIFSVSHSLVGEVAKYIAEQEEHHQKRSFSEELQMFVERYGPKWHQENETVENGFMGAAQPDHPAEAGCY